MDLPPIGPQTTKRRKPAFRIEPSQFDILKNIFAVLHVTPALFLSSADHSTILEKLNDVQGGAPLLAAHAAHTVEFRKRVDAKYGEWLCPQPAQPKPPGQPRTINPRAPRMLAAAANLAAYELNKEAKEKESTDREKANRDRWSEVEARARTLLAQPVATNVSSWNDERFQDSLSDQDEIDVEAGRLFAEISAEVATMNRSRHAAEVGAMTETLVALSTLRRNFSRMKPSQPESEMALPSPLFFSTSQTPKGKRRDAPLSEKPREKQRRTDRGWGRSNGACPEESCSHPSHPLWYSRKQVPPTQPSRSSRRQLPGRRLICVPLCIPCRCPGVRKVGPDHRPFESRLHTQPHTPDALFWNILVIPCVKPQDELSKPHTALKRKPSMTENCSLTDRDSRHLHIGPYSPPRAVTEPLQMGYPDLTCGQRESIFLHELSKKGCKPTDCGFWLASDWLASDWLIGG